MKKHKQILSLLLAVTLTALPALALCKSTTVTGHADLTDDIVNQVTDKITDKVIEDVEKQVTNIISGNTPDTPNTSNPQAPTASAVAVSSVVLNTHTMTLYSGSSESLSATILPENATNKLLTWSSSNPLIAKVDIVGNRVSVIAGSLPGKATIAVRSPEGVSDTCTVHVKELPGEEVTSITLDETTKVLHIGESATLTATVNPSSAKDKSVYWTSSNNEVVTVDSTGKITGVSEGNAHVRVTSIADNSRYAICSISVMPAQNTEDNNKADEDAKIQTQQQIKAIQNTKARLLSVTPRDGRLKVTASQKTVDGVAVKYQFRYRQKGAKKWKAKSSPSRNVDLKNLKRGKKYTLQVRVFATIDQKKYYGGWSSSVTKKTK